MDLDGQRRVVEFLASGDAFGGNAPAHIETHISHIFLTGDRAYKMKRAVRLNFLDFATLDQRRIACEREVALNARGAPGLYLGTVPVTGRGKLTLDGSGEPVEWLVEMRRFEQKDQFDNLARDGRLEKTHVAALAERLIAYHGRAERRPDQDGADSMKRTAARVTDNLRNFGGAFLDGQSITGWDQGIQHAFDVHSSLMEARRQAGFVRQCHGDLHLANICLFEGEPMLFDCIEFSDDIACIDVLYDLAFLCMDLVFRELPAYANLVLNRVLSATRDFDGLPLMPAFMSLRAAIRAMTGLIALSTEDNPAPHELDEARLHLALARDLLSVPTPRLVAVGGLSGSGKSTLAANLAAEIAPGAGAVVISSDVIRKRLFEVTPETKLPKEAYAGDVSERTYRRMMEDVGTALNAGQTVIADATFIRPEDRGAVAESARARGFPFTGIWLDAPVGELRERVGRRRGDPSDADLQVIDKQRSQSSGTIDWAVLDSTCRNLVSDAISLIES